MSNDLVARLRSKIIVHTDAAVWMLEAANRIEQLEAKLGEYNLLWQVYDGNPFQMYVNANEARIAAEAKLAEADERIAWLDCGFEQAMADTRAAEAKLANVEEDRDDALIALASARKQLERYIAEAEAAPPMPCPFCGGEATCIENGSHSTAWEIGCYNGQCAAKPSVWEPRKEMAIAAWNTRADLATPLDDPRVKALVEAAREVKADCIARADKNGVVPIGRSAWDQLTAALSALEESQ